MLLPANRLDVHAGALAGKRERAFLHRGLKLHAAFGQLGQRRRHLGGQAPGLQAVQALERWAPNVLFLDIQMPGLSGIEVARRASGKAHVVFITAYDRYALEAFEQGALDYILKPIDTGRMKLTITRLQQRGGYAYLRP